MMAEQKRTQRAQVAVIGAGIAGLSAAYELQKAGVRVEVFEQSNRPGGRMVTQTVKQLAFDGGADFFSQNYTTLKSYAKELGIDWLPTRTGGRHRVIRGGKPYYLQFANVSDLRQFRLISRRSRLRLGLWLARLMLERRTFDLFNLSTIPARYDFDNAVDYVSRVAGKETADYIVDSFTSIMQFHRAKEISTSALFALMQTMIAKGSRFALCSTPAGINQIPTALAKQLNVHYGAAVASVGSSMGRPVLSLTGGKPTDYEAIILATPATAALNLLNAPSITVKQLLRSVVYAQTITVAFRIPADLFPDLTHLSYVPFIESKLIGGYANEGAKLGRRNHAGHSLINVYLHEESAKKMMQWSDKKIFTTVLVELKKLCPEVAQSLEVTPLAIARWKQAMPKFAHRYVSQVRAFLETEQGRGGIYFAGDYLNAPWTEGAARSGQRAAALVIKQLRV